MKQFIKIFLICYVISTLFFIFIFGNLSFGESGFHIDIYDIIEILVSWALISSIVITGIVYFITKRSKKN